MRFDKPIKAKYDVKEKKVAISISLYEDVVVTKKVSISEFRQIVAQLDSTIHEIDSLK